LVALTTATAGDRYVLFWGEAMIGGGFPTLAAAVARFEALLDAAITRGESPPARTDSPAGGAEALPPQDRPANLTDLDEYRRRRRR
jgi:hypothetical protein